MLVDVGQTKRPDLQHAIEKMMADPPVRLESAAPQHAPSSQFSNAFLRQSKQSNRRSMQSVDQIIEEVENDGISPSKPLLGGNMFAAP